MIEIYLNTKYQKKTQVIQHVKFVFFKIVFVFLFYSCNNINRIETNTLNNEQVTKKRINDMDSMIVDKKIFENQLRKGASTYIDLGWEVTDLSFSEHELLEMFNVIDFILKQNGYKEISAEVFLKKTKDIFGRELLMNSKNKYVYVNFLVPCDRLINKMKNNGINSKGIFINKNNKFLSEFYFLPELIDYKDLYKELISKEITFSSIYKDKGHEFIIHKWMDQETLDDDRRKNINLIIHRNKYLFNDNNASLTWLMLNDKFFLMDLVKEFGYVEDKELLKWVIDETPIRDSYSRLNIADYLRLFYTTTCDNKLILHQETMDMMVMNDKEKHFNEFKDLISELNRDDSVLDDFTFAKKAKLYAYLFETVRRMRDEDYEAIVTVGGFYDFYNDIFRLAEEFEKNNYYGYTGLKEFLEKAEETGKGTHSGGEY